MRKLVNLLESSVLIRLALEAPFWIPFSCRRLRRMACRCDLVNVPVNILDVAAGASTTLAVAAVVLAVVVLATAGLGAAGLVTFDFVVLVAFGFVAAFADACF